MTYKIAISTSDGRNIDLHFGQLQALAIYQVDEENGSFSFLETRQIDRTSLEKEEENTGCSCGKAFVSAVVNSVKDCTYFLVAKIGNRPYRMLQENNVNCIEAPFEIKEAICKVNAYYIMHKQRELHVF